MGYYALEKTYSWFDETLTKGLNLALSGFWELDFDVKLLGVFEAACPFFKGEDFFVTEIKIAKNKSVFFRLSMDSIEILLDSALGMREEAFNIEALSELEAKILTAFCDFIYKIFGKNFVSTENLNKKDLKDETPVHLVFYARKDEYNSFKIIISVPRVLLAPKAIEVGNLNLSEENFKTSKCQVNIKVGSSKIALNDLKCLAEEDVLVLENSIANNLTLKYTNLNLPFKAAEDPSLFMDLENDDVGEDMENDSKNLWDNIQVEIEANFEKVKITLGELKQISQGLVVDLGSIFKNQITLRVENKKIALGELVIVNDRYGVKINEILTNEAEAPQQQGEAGYEVAQNAEAQGQEEDDFDYSDFDLDDEEI